VAACALPRIGLVRGQLGTTVFQTYGERVLHGAMPYRDFSLEYPPGALPAFIVPAFGPSSDYDTLFMLAQAACGLACVALVGAATRSVIAAAYCALAPLALGPLVLHRFDLWPTLLATAGLVAFLGRRERTGAVALALGTAAKVFPLVLLPPLVLGVRRRVRVLTWFCGALLLAFLPFMAAAPGGIRFSVERQFDRPLQIESAASSVLLALHAIGVYTPRVAFGAGSWNLVGPLPRLLAALSTLVAIAAVVAVWVVYARGPRTPRRCITAAAAAVAVWIAFGKVLSPQFTVWLIPLVALERRRRESVLLIVVLALTRSVYPTRYDELVHLDSAPIALLCARNVVLIALGISLVLRLQPQCVLQEIGGEDDRSDAHGDVLLHGRERDGPDDVPRLEPRERE
jgi:uncharacterized membrane protein